jgi:HEAT repeat protein
VTTRRWILVGLFTATVATVGGLLMLSHPSTVTIVDGRVGIRPSIPACSSAESCYQGRTLEQWRRIAEDQSPGRSIFERYEAITGLTHFGERAVPILAALLRDRESSIRAHTARMLGSMGPTAKDAVPALLEVWKEPDDFSTQTPVEAGRALGDIGASAPEVVPALTAILRDPNYQSNKPRAALYALGRIGTDAREAAPVLVALLPGPLGSQAADALSRIGPDSETTRRSMAAVWIRLLEDPDHVDRYQLDRAADGLTKLGPEGLPLLVKLLAKRDLPQRSRIVEVLGRYRSAAVPALTMALMDPDLELRLYVPGSLQAAGAAGVPALIQALKDEDAGVRMNAALALGRIGPPAGGASLALVAQATHDPWPGARMNAIDALGLIGPPARGAAFELRHVSVADPDPEMRRRAEAALNRIESH